MKPRHASAAITIERYVRQVFACDVAEWRRLPVQWRGFVFFNQHRHHTVKAMLDVIDRGSLPVEYDPQGVFDAFQGLAPA